MLNIFFQEAKDKQEYYDKLRACFTDFDPELDEYLEKELQEDLNKLENCEDQDERTEINAEINLWRFLICMIHECVPLVKALICMEIEKCPDGIEELSKKYAAGEPLSDQSEINVRREDIFEILLLYSPTNRKKIIHTLSCSAMRKDDLLDALTAEDKESFCQILKNDCDYTVFSHCFGRIAQLHIYLEGFEELKAFLIRASQEEDTQGEMQRLQFYSEYELSHRSEHENKIFSFIEGDADIKQIRSNIEQPATPEEASILTTFLEHLYVLIGYIALSEIDEYDPEEQSIFRPVLESEEFKQHYEENKDFIEGFEKKMENYVDSLGPDEQEEVKQIEAPAEELEPEKQQVQQQMDTPSEDAIPQNDSPQEDTGLQERTHKACDFSKYDGLFDTRGDLPNKNEYLEVLNAKFKKDGVWPVLLAFLYQHGYLSLPDIPRFVYRMTGKRVGNFSLITKIEWKNHPEDLHYLCTALHGSVPINNMKAFFDFGKDDKRFHGKYDPTREMKSFLKINFEYTK